MLTRFSLRKHNYVKCKRQRKRTATGSYRFLDKHKLSLTKLLAQRRGVSEWNLAVNYNLQLVLMYVKTKLFSRQHGKEKLKCVVGTRV